MKKTIIVIIIILIVISSFFIFKNSKTEEENLCEKSGGTWREFSNGCVDSCSAKGEDIFCTQVLTMGCDCGVDRCWNGLSCV